MNGVIIIPTFYEKRHLAGNKSQRSRILLSALSKEYGMPLIYTDRPDLDGLDIALIYAVPYHNRPSIPLGLLNAKAKLIGYFEDLPCWNSQECLKNKEILFKRFDIIMGACYKSFRETYSQYLYKYIHFPNFFFPLRRYKDLKVNLHPKMRCLMAGALNSFYPFRIHIRRLVERQKFSLLDITKVPFVSYVETLNEYFCAIATSGRTGDVLAKYLEIPAAGTLLLAEELMELEVMGLKPNVHYVPVTKKNVLSQIQYVLSNPRDFFEMRNKAMSFVRENHSEINRIRQFGQILKRL